MQRDRHPDLPGRRSVAPAPARVPGKQTLAEASGVGAARARKPPGGPPPASPRGPRPSLQALFGGPRASGATDVHAVAARGVATPSSPLPFADQIQRSFGAHDVSAIQAHTGGDAAASAQAMGARAYATGPHVVLGDGADLHTVAHEAAHVVQQRGGVQLAGGVGQSGDVYERHADAVADRVVAGESAAELLGAPAPAMNRGGGVQHKLVKGNHTTVGQEYRDDRGGPVLYEAGTEYPGWYYVGQTSYYYYAETDQFCDATGTWWDPITERTFTVDQQWYVHDGARYTYNGRAYVPAQHDTTEHVASTELGTGFEAPLETEALTELGTGFETPLETEAPIETEAPMETEVPIDLDSVEVDGCSEAAIREEGIKDVGMAITFVKMYVGGQEWEKAWSLLKGWNQHYEKFDQPAKLATTVQSKKRQREPEKSRLITAKECGLERKHIGHAQRDKQREQEAQQKKQRRTLDKLEVDGETYPLEPLSTSGGFYDVYTIGGTKQIVPDVANDQLVLRIPKEGPDTSVTRKGMLDRDKIAGVSLPKVHNKPGQAGYYLVEKITHGCNPATWQSASSFGQLPPLEQERLTAARKILVANANAGRQIVPDFRPNNIRFRSAESAQIVLVDFTDEGELMQDHGLAEFAREMKHLLTEFCKTLDGWLYRFLTEGMNTELLSKIQEVELF